MVATIKRTHRSTDDASVKSEESSIIDQTSVPTNASLTLSNTQLTVFTVVGLRQESRDKMQRLIDSIIGRIMDNNLYK